MVVRYWRLTDHAVVIKHVDKVVCESNKALKIRHRREEVGWTWKELKYPDEYTSFTVSLE